MKKTLLLLALVIAGICPSVAQRFAMIDMEYVLRNVPGYEMANEQLNQASQRWEQEVQNITNEAQNMYKNYQSQMVFMTDEQKKAKEEAIVAKEKEATELRYKYFGPEGELFKKRQSLMQPIQDEVYNAVKAVAQEKGYQAVFDRASSQSIVFATPAIDISNEVLSKLGYSK